MLGDSECFPHSHGVSQAQNLRHLAPFALAEVHLYNIRLNGQAMGQERSSYRQLLINKILRQTSTICELQI